MQKKKKKKKTYQVIILYITSLGIEIYNKLGNRNYINQNMFLY